MMDISNHSRRSGFASHLPWNNNGTICTSLQKFEALWVGFWFSVVQRSICNPDISISIVDKLMFMYHDDNTYLCLH